MHYRETQRWICDECGFEEKNRVRFAEHIDKTGHVILRYVHEIQINGKDDIELIGTKNLRDFIDFALRLDEDEWLQLQDEFEHDLKQCISDK